MKKIIKTILVLTLVFSSSIVGDINKVSANEVNIPDASFRACLNDGLGQERTAPIMQEQLRLFGYELECKATSFDEPIRDITGIEYLINTSKFYFYGNEIVDFSPLNEATRMGTLYIRDNPAIDFETLRESHVRSLSVINSNITDVSLVTSLPNLYDLNLSENPLGDLSPIGEVDNLEYLKLASTGIDEIGFMSELIKLRLVDLTDNNVSDISPLSKATELSKLYLDNNNVRDFTPVVENNVGNYGGLSVVHAGGNGITDEDLKVLEGVQLIWELKLNDNEIYNFDFTKFNYPAIVDLSGNHITDVSTLNDTDPINWRPIELNLADQTIELPATTIEGTTHTIDNMVTGFEKEEVQFDSGATETFVPGETKQMNATWKSDYYYTISMLETRKSEENITPRSDGMIDVPVNVKFNGVVTQEVTAEASKSEVVGNNAEIEVGSEQLSNEELIKLLGISAIDYDGSEITPEFKVVSNNIDYKTPGNYNVTISFIDSLGIEVTNTFNVDVIGDVVVNEEPGSLAKTGMVNAAGIFIIMFAVMIKLRKYIM